MFTVYEAGLIDYGAPALFSGTRQECYGYMRRNWHKVRDGFDLIDNSTGRYSSFVL